MSREDSLRRTATPVHVWYDVGHTRNLFAGEIAAYKRNGLVYLVLDFTQNLHVRSKQGNQYLDACELREKHARVKTLYIEEGILTDFVAFARAASTGADKCRAQIVLEDQRFTYKIVDVNHTGSVALGLEFEPEE